MIYGDAKAKVKKKKVKYFKIWSRLKLFWDDGKNFKVEKRSESSFLGQKWKQINTTGKSKKANGYKKWMLFIFYYF